MNNFYKFLSVLKNNVLVLFFLFFIKLNAAQDLDSQKNIQSLIDRCRKQIEDFPSLNDPMGCLTLEEERQLSYAEKRKLLHEALNAYLYHADIR